VGFGPAVAPAGGRDGGYRRCMRRRRPTPRTSRRAAGAAAVPDRGARVPAPPDRRLVAGIIGPAAFTLSWVAATVRQHGHGEYHVAREHISGLAAPDARHPRLMTAAFLILGAATNVFGAALREQLGGARSAGPGPVLIQVAGLAAFAAGLLRRDRMLLGLPEGVARQSWRNDGHDIASGVVYGSLIAAPVALAYRFRRDAEHQQLVTPALGTAGLT